ncbi:glycosyltransferase [Methylacidimicrobium tartarophylax]|nr:glycosyltransferase [Methylacidimicrobium tartarophylax]
MEREVHRAVGCAIGESMGCLRVALVIPGIPKISGGPGVSVAAMAGRLVANGWEVTVLTSNQGISEGLVPIEKNVELKIFPLSGKWNRRFLRCPELIEWLYREGSRFDVVDIQGIWSFICSDMAKACQALRIPYVITPHGQASKWDVGKAPVRKRIFASLWLSGAWKGASGYRFLSEEERRGCWFPEAGKGVITPNWLEPAQKPEDHSSTEALRSLELRGDGQTVLFLGRLDPQKGVLELLHVFEQLWRRRPETVLLLVGPGRTRYAEQVRRRVDSMTGSRNIRLLGPLYGVEKQAVLGAASVFVALSKSEGLPTAVLEALRASIPVIVTPGANIPEVEEYGAGFVVHGREDAVTKIETILQDSGLRSRMAENAKRLFEQRFSPENVFPNLIAFYRAIVGKSRDQSTRTNIA